MRSPCNGGARVCHVLRLCSRGSAAPKPRGAIRYNSSRPSLTPFGPPYPPGESDGDLQPAPPPSLDADGRLDVVWQHDLSGALAAWNLDGTTMFDSTWLTPSTVGAGWTIRAVGDLNRDGKPDLVWEHTDGWVAV